MVLALASAGGARAAAGEQGMLVPAGPVPLIGPIEVGDVLDVGILGINGPNLELRKRVRVAADGTVSLYWMSPVKLAGLDVAEAAQAIRKACVDQVVEDVDWIDVERIESAARSGIGSGPLGPGDLVELTTRGLLGPNVDSTHRVQLDANGMIALPYVGLVHAAGLHEQGLEAAAVKSYREVNLFQHAAIGALRVRAAKAAEAGVAPIASGDLLLVSTTFPPYDDKEVSFGVRVGTDGRAPLPGAGGVKLGGMSVAEAAVAIEKAMARAQPSARPPVWLLRMDGDEHAQVPPGPIAAGDAVEVLIAGIGPAVWQRTMRVDLKGNLRLPFLGNTNIAGLTEVDAQAAIVRAYHKVGDHPEGEHVAFTLRRVSEHE